MGNKGEARVTILALDARQLYLLRLIGEEGACNSEEVKTDQHEPWFPERGQRNADAKRVCAGCKVREECLEYALTTNETGIWGGLSERERDRLKRRVS